MPWIFVITALAALFFLAAWLVSEKSCDYWRGRALLAERRRERIEQETQAMLARIFAANEKRS